MGEKEGRKKERKEGTNERTNERRFREGRLEISDSKMKLNQNTIEERRSIGRR